MAYGMNDRVREQVSGFGGGTGALTLPGVAVSGFQTFLAGWGASGTGEYAIVSGSQWEVGLGTLNAGGTTLTRTTVYNGSSGAGVAVNFTGGTMDCFGDIPAELAHYLNMREITVASATTCNIGAVSGSSIEISGTTTITSFGTSKSRRRFVRFSGILTLTHDGTTLILPGAANITTAAGDTAMFASDASGNWRCYQYTRGALAPFDRRAPGAIGGTTPAAGTFTTLNTSGAITVGSPTAYGTAMNVIGTTAARVSSIQNSHNTAGDANTFMTVGATTGDTTSIYFEFADGPASATQGKIRRNGTGAVAYDTTSDIRGKPNREPLSPDAARAIIDAMRIWDFDKDGNAIRGIGVVAQEAYRVHKSLASPGRTEDEWWTAEKAAAVPFLVANLQLANAKIDELERRLAAVEEKNQ